MSRSGSPTPKAPNAPVWGRLFRCASSESALREIAQWLGLDDRVVLELSDGSSIVAGIGDGGGTPEVQRSEEVAGRPPWYLSMRAGAPRLITDAEFARAAEALAAWRAARLERERAEARRAARVRDLETLHVLGGRLAEATTPDDLLGIVAAALDDRVGVDAVGWAHAFAGRPTVEIRALRPCGDDAIAGIVRDAARDMGWDDAAGPSVAVVAAGDADHDLGRRDEVGPDEIAFVPLLRRGARIAHLVVVAPRMTLGPRVHVVFGAGRTSRFISTASSR